MCMDYSQTINLYTELDAYPLPRIEDMVNTLSEYKVFSTYDLKSTYHQIPIKKYDKKYTAFEGNGQLCQFRVVLFGVTNGVPVFQRLVNKIIKEERLSGTFPYMDNVTIVGNSLVLDQDKNDKAFHEMIERRNITLNVSKSLRSVPLINIYICLYLYIYI